MDALYNNGYERDTRRRGNVFYCTYRIYLKSTMAYEYISYRYSGLLYTAVWAEETLGTAVVFWLYERVQGRYHFCGMYAVLLVCKTLGVEVGRWALYDRGLNLVVGQVETPNERWFGINGKNAARCVDGPGRDGRILLRTAATTRTRYSRNTSLFTRRYVGKLHEA